MVKHKLRICSMCGDTYYTTGKFCQNCSSYLRRHPEGRYAIPPKGVIFQADNGDVVCHICGYAFRKLGSHIAYKHHLTQKEYRDMFDLYHNTKLSNGEYITKMSQLNNINQDVVVKKNLIEGGKNTRVSKQHRLVGRKSQRKIKTIQVN